MQPQISIYDKINYYLLITFLILGVILYDFIGARFEFTYTDEIFVSILTVYSILRRSFSKEFLVFIGIALFYLLYSFMYPINTDQAILTDFFIQIKPFMAFYCAYNLGIYITPRYFKRIRQLCMASAIIMIPIGILGENFMMSIDLHPSRFATIITILGTLYYYCSRQDRYARSIAAIIWSIGLLSLKAKFYGFYVAVLFFFFIYPNKKFRLSPKIILLLTACLSMIVFVAWEKISYYYIAGAQADSIYARPYLYMNSITILNDYFPFGSGFGTYATHASDQFYSPLYFKYKMYLNYEIGNKRFLSDTFFPSLAQFGYIGIAFFTLFWYRIFQIGKSLKNFKIILLIILFFFIESTADATFTQNRGIYMLVLLAMFLNQEKYLKSILKRKKLNNYKQECLSKH